jgi:hypothetical protein
MRVRHTSSDRKSEPWLAIGAEYTVLAVEISLDRQTVMYRLDPFHGIAPALFPSGDFEVVSALAPELWKVTVSRAGILLAPPRWAHPGFWELLFDRDDQATRDFEEDRRALVAADPGR